MNLKNRILTGYQSREVSRKHASVLVFALAATILFAITGIVQGEHPGNGLYQDSTSEIQVNYSYSSVDDLSGRLAIGGSQTMQPMLRRLAAEFTAMYPKVKIGVEGDGSTAAIRQFTIGYSSQRRGEKSRSGHDGASQTTVLASSRELTEKELDTFVSRYGYRPLVFPIAMDAVAIYVNGNNPLTGLTVDQVDAIFSSTRKRGLPPMTTWGQVGLTENWAARPIRAYGRNRESGTHDFFELVALDAGKLSEDVILTHGSATEILEISRDPSAIGFAGIGFQTSLVRVLPLARHAGDPYISPNADSVRKREYPLSRFLYLYVNQAPSQKFDPALHEFLKFANSREGQRAVVDSKLYALPSTTLAENLRALTGETITALFPLYNKPQKGHGEAWCFPLARSDRVDETTVPARRASFERWLCVSMGFGAWHVSSWRVLSAVPQGRLHGFSIGTQSQWSPCEKMQTQGKGIVILRP